MVLPGASRGIEKKKKTGSYQFRFLLRVEAFRVGMEGASGSRLLPRMEGFRVYEGRCFRVSVLSSGGRV